MVLRTQKEVNVKLGRMVATIGVAGLISSEDLQVAVFKHQHGDWGNVCEEDWEANNEAAKEGYRILSSYKDSNDVIFWIITEADRSVTTILLPDEY